MWGLSSAKINSLHSSFQPSEMEITLPKTASCRSCVGIIIKRSHTQSSHPMRCNCQRTTAYTGWSPECSAGRTLQQQQPKPKRQPFSLGNSGCFLKSKLAATDWRYSDYELIPNQMECSIILLGRFFPLLYALQALETLRFRLVQRIAAWTPWDYGER